MNNTRKITIALDSTAIQKHVCAESACIALMSDIEHTEILTPDHRALLQLYAHDAFLSLAAGIASTVDESAFSVPCPDASLFQLPLSVSADSQCSAKQLLALAEKYVACAVLAECYTAHIKLKEHFIRKRDKAFFGIRTQLSRPLLSDRKAYRY